MSAKRLSRTIPDTVVSDMQIMKRMEGADFGDTGKLTMWLSGRGNFVVFKNGKDTGRKDSEKH